jgi:hypothetical protein
MSTLDLKLFIETYLSSFLVVSVDSKSSLRLVLCKQWMLIPNYIYEKFGLTHNVNFYLVVITILWKLTDSDFSWYYENLIIF